MTPDSVPPAVPPLEASIRGDLLDRWGPLLQGEALRVALGYSSGAALRQSLARGTAPVTLFKIPGRRGHYALTWQVAHWLARQGTAPAETATASVQRRPPADP